MAHSARLARLGMNGHGAAPEPGVDAGTGLAAVLARGQPGWHGCVLRAHPATPVCGHHPGRPDIRHHGLWGRSVSADEHHGRDDELARLRAVLAKLESDPEHRREMAALPPLTPKQRHVVAWAFRSQSLAPAETTVWQQWNEIDSGALAGPTRLRRCLRRVLRVDTPTTEKRS